MDQRNDGRRARRSRQTGRDGAQEATRLEQGVHQAPGLQDVLGRFSDALSMLAVVHRSLSAQEFTGIGDEEVTLRHAIEDLQSVYNELDVAASRRTG